MRPHHTVPLPLGRDAPPPGRFPADLVGPFEATLAAPHAPLAARAAVAAWMAGHVDETTLADAQLLVVELVANSVRQADAPADAALRIRGEIRGDALRLEVEDRGRGGSIARRAADLQHGGGFGMNVVEALSRRWGVDRDAGTRVWAEIGIRAVARDPADRRPAVPTRSNGGRGHLRIVDRHDAKAHHTHSATTHRLGDSGPDAA